MPKVGKRKASAAKQPPVKQKQVTKPKAGSIPRKAPSITGTRRLKQPKRLWYRPKTWRYKPVRPTYAPLPKARILLQTELKQLWDNKKLFGGIALTYGLLNIVLVRGLAGSTNLVTIKDSLKGVGGHIASSLSSFVYLLGTSGSGNTATSGVYQGMLLIVCSLAFIWALRQTLAKNTARVRDSFYSGMYPLVPFVLLLFVIGIQLLPLAIGGGLYATVVSGGIAVHAWEKVSWLLVFIGFSIWSLRMLASTLFALYIVTLPDMTPFKALRSARQLVIGRRLLIWRKLIFLPVVLLVAAAIIELPLILFLTVLAPWVFFILSTAALAVVHGYVYNLYREML